MLQVLDHATSPPGAAAIRAAGYVGSVRYLRRRSPWWGTPLTTAEVDDYRVHGLGLALVYQDNDKGRVLQGFAAGAEDARWALAEAMAVGVALPRCIYFAADRDLISPAEIAAVLAYLDGAASVLGRDRVGIYGEADLIDAAVPAHATFGWQPIAWSRGRVSVHARILQLAIAQQTRVNGVLCDRNNVLNPDWGQNMLIIPREAWGARYSDGADSAPVPYAETWLHHSAGLAPDLVWTDRDGDGIEDDEVAFMRHLEQIGQDRFGAGISYTWLVFPSGRIYEGHGVDRQGTHTGGRNDRARAACLVGNYEGAAPTVAQLRAVAWLLQHEHAADHRTSLALSGGHCDLKATKCPGAAAYALIPEINRLAAGRPITSLTDPIAVAPAPQSEEDDMPPFRPIVFVGERTSSTVNDSTCAVLLPGPDGNPYWWDVTNNWPARADAQANWERTDNGRWDHLDSTKAEWQKLAQVYTSAPVGGA